MSGLIERLFAELERGRTGIRGFEEQIDQATRAIMQKRKELSAGVLAWVSGLAEPDRREAARRLYWEYEDLVKTTELAAELSLSVLGVSRYVGPYAVPGKCSKHGQIEVFAGTRSQLKDLRDDIKRGLVNCPQCEEEWLSGETRRIELREMPYHEYLQTGEWQERRKGKLERAGYRCQLCSDVGLLDVHHNTYERRGDEDDEDLIVLCRDCHAKHHDKVATAPRRAQRDKKVVKFEQARA